MNGSTFAKFAGKRVVIVGPGKSKYTTRVRYMNEWPEAVFEVVTTSLRSFDEPAPVELTKAEELRLNARPADYRWKR